MIGEIKSITAIQGKGLITIEITGNDNLNTLEALRSQNKTIDIKEHKERRSLDANAYMWVLIGKLQEVIIPPRSKEKIYKDYIRDVGSYEIIPIKEEAVKRFREAWESNGLGWITETAGKCQRTPRYINVVAHYGSSSYDTKEMSKLISMIVEDCKEQGIETKTQAELDSLLEQWGKKDEQILNTKQPE